MPKRQTRPIRTVGDISFVPLTRGYEAIIDAADAALVEGRNWRAWLRGNHVYAASTASVDGRQVDLILHRLLLQPPPGLVVDHIDGNTLNCRRSNLRPCTITENVRSSRRRKLNAVGVKGVFATAGGFAARITADRREYYLGTYDTVAEAKAAYFGAAKVLFGEFANAG